MYLRLRKCRVECCIRALWAFTTQVIIGEAPIVITDVHAGILFDSIGGGAPNRSGTQGQITIETHHGVAAVRACEFTA